MTDRLKTIVIVNDDPERTPILPRHLSLNDFIVHQITSGSDIDGANREIQSRKPDLVIIDRWRGNGSVSGSDLFMQVSGPAILNSIFGEVPEVIQQTGLPENKRIFDLGKGTEELLEVIENLLKRNNQ